MGYCFCLFCSNCVYLLETVTAGNYNTLRIIGFTVHYINQRCYLNAVLQHHNLWVELQFFILNHREVLTYCTVYIVFWFILCMSKVIPNNCLNVFYYWEKIWQRGCCSRTFVYMTGWLEMSVCCAESTKGRWKESWFCTEYKKALVKKSMCCLVQVKTLLSLFASQ